MPRTTKGINRRLGRTPWNIKASPAAIAKQIAEALSTEVKALLQCHFEVMN